MEWGRHVQRSRQRGRAHSGKSWRFNTTVRYGSEYVDDYQEMDVLMRSSYDAYDPANAQWGRGQRTGMIDGSGSASWRYDQRGRMRWESKTISGSGTFVSEWSYNSAGLLAWMKYPGGNGGQQGETVTYSYHPQMLVKNADSSFGYYYLQNAGYDAAGRIDQRLLEADNLGAFDRLSNPLLVHERDYFAWNTANGLGRLKALKTQTGGSPPTVLQDLRYYSGTDTAKYDPAGNLLNIYDYVTANPQTQTFGYDSLNRLTSASASGGTSGVYSESYSYNGATGNLATKVDDNYSYGAQSAGCAEGALPSRPHAVTTAGSTGYCYDQNGSMTRRDPLGDPVYNFQYNAENRLVGVSGSATASFVYDGDGQRVKGTVNGSTVVYIGTWFEWSGSNGTMKRYYYAGGNRIAMREGDPSSEYDTVGLIFLFGDHPSLRSGQALGSTSLSYRADTAVQAQELYRAWGESRLSTNPAIPTSFRYTGQRSEASGIGLLYYGARWYDPYLNQPIHSRAGWSDFLVMYQPPESRMGIPVQHSHSQEVFPCYPKSKTSSIGCAAATPRRAPGGTIHTISGSSLP